MIVPFAAGGPVDVMARLVGQLLGGLVGQPVVVENRGGASGGIGSKLVASAEPDGHTLLCGNISSLVIQPIMTNNRDFDLFKSFVPVARLSQNVEVLAVHPDFPASSVRELIAYAKANPGKLNYGSGGVGNISQLAAELFRLRTGIDIVHVPFKGASEVLHRDPRRPGADVVRRHRRHAAADPRKAARRRWRCRARRAPANCQAADHDGKRRARLSGLDLHRRDGAGQNTARGRNGRLSQSHQSQPRHAGGHGHCGQPQRRRHADTAGGVRRVSTQRIRQMVRSGAERRHQD